MLEAEVVQVKESLVMVVVALCTHATWNSCQSVLAVSAVSLNRCKQPSKLSRAQPQGHRCECSLYGPQIWVCVCVCALQRNPLLQHVSLPSTQWMLGLAAAPVTLERIRGRSRKSWMKVWLKRFRIIYIPHVQHRTEISEESKDYVVNNYAIVGCNKRTTDLI